MLIIPAHRRAATVLAVVIASVATACGGDSASPPKPVATALQATSSSTQSATVGTTVPAPSVKAVTSSGSPVPGVSVTFAVSGGGSIGTTSATTGADGVASAGSWTLGTTAGANTVTATASGMQPVTFTVTGVAGPAASLTTSAGDNQSAAVGAAGPAAPAGVVKDQDGPTRAGATGPVSGGAGGGAITGATATTGADGVAKLGGWTLGIASGTQRLKATSGSLSTTIAATATVPTGCKVINYALGATLPLNWESDDCTVPSTMSIGWGSVAGRRYDQLRFTTTQQEQVDAAVTGPDGRMLLLRDSRGLYVGLQASPAFSPLAQNPMHMKYVLAPGTYTYEPLAPSATATGSYSLTTTTNTKIDCDYIVFTTTNVTINGTVDNSSCLQPNGIDREQWFNLQLKTGMKIRLTLSNTDVAPGLLIRDDRLGPASPLLAVKTGTKAGDVVVIDWTATFDQWHEVIVFSRGKYTLKIEELP